MMMMMTKKNSNVEKKESNNDGPRYRCVLIFLGGGYAHLCVFYSFSSSFNHFFLLILSRKVFFSI